MDDTRAGADGHGWVEAFTERWEAAWNSHHADRLLELMTADVIYDDSGWPTTMYGHGAVRAYLDFIWRAIPDLTFTVAEGPFADADGSRAAFYWKGSGTFTGPLDPPGYAPTGARIAFDGFDLHEYRGGRVCRLRIVFDMMDVGRQIGLLPRTGSRLENAGAVGQRLVVRARDRLRR
jgi:steroid delta-isomerase-like uncharacterized protein